MTAAHVLEAKVTEHSTAEWSVAMHAPNPLIALGVMASTALTDAVYVLFNSAVSRRRNCGSPLPT